MITQNVVELWQGDETLGIFYLKEEGSGVVRGYEVRGAGYAPVRFPVACEGQAVAEYDWRRNGRP